MTDYQKLINRLILIPIGIVLAGFLFHSVTYASTDLTVTCSDTDCVITPAGVSLFNEPNLLPGDNFTQNLTIINNSSDSCPVILNVIDTTPIQNVTLAEKIWVAIYSGVVSYYGSHSADQAIGPTTYQDLFDTSDVSLATMLPSTVQTYTWLATLDINTGNTYQQASTVFDLGLTVTCGSPDENLTLTFGADGGGGDGDGGGGGDGDGADGGGGDATVSFLSAVAGLFGPDLFPVIGGVLGVGEGLESITIPEEEQLGEVAGVTSCEGWRFYWPWILVAFLLFLILVIYAMRKRKIRLIKQSLVIATMVALISILYWLTKCQ